VEIIKDAKAQGYTEPDPRDDLSGIDVARKIVCLARELGQTVHLDQVKVDNLVPEPLRDVDVNTFLQELSKYDDEINKLTEKAHLKNHKLAYVASISAAGKINVGIKEFPHEHAFAKLTGTDNMLIFKTRRYDKQPLIIQGPGAGAEVTAAGVFADLLRLVSSLS